MATFAKSWRWEYLEGEAGFFEDFDEWFPVIKDARRLGQVVDVDYEIGRQNKMKSRGARDVDSVWYGL